jgi:hypothetical protein
MFLGVGSGLGLYGVLVLIVCILNIILFFKIWGMTNDIKKLVSFYMHENGITFKKESELVDGVPVDKDGKHILIKTS